MLVEIQALTVRLRARNAAPSPVAGIPAGCDDPAVLEARCGLASRVEVSLNWPGISADGPCRGSRIAAA